MKKVTLIRCPSISFLGTIALIVCGAAARAQEPESPRARRPNVLFIAVDDLRPQLGCYGVEGMASPNIDRLAAEGVRFDRSYCMVPTCGASRASLMSGIRPTRKRFVTYTARADREAPGITTLNTHFKEHGYRTASNGKVFHFQADSAEGWSEPPWRPKAETYQDPLNRRRANDRRAELGDRGRGPAFESADVPDDSYADGMLADRSIDDLRRLADRDEPFFLAVGFFKPHLPFVAPKNYWDLYDPDRIRLPETYHVPENAPDQAIHNWGELRSYADIPAEGPLTDDDARNLIRGYYACVSYTDAQIGRLLDELDRLGLADETIVVLWGDHGWNLGEHTLWCKHCCFETSMRAPLIVRAPGIEGGRSVTALTEFIDLYPSLCELAGLPLPPHLEGRSFAPLLYDPDAAPPEPTAISRFANGDTIRTDRYRYTEYSDRDGRLTARMLYDHQLDPNEDQNIVNAPDSATIVRDLARLLRDRKGIN